MVSLMSYAMGSVTPGDSARTFLSSYDQSTQPYRFFIPEAAKKGEPLPLLVVLHGKWVDQNAWFDYTPVKNYAQQRGFVVIAPYARGDYFYRGPGEQDVLDLIQEAQTLVSIDSSRIYLMGHSMGGWGTWWLGLRHPDMFAAICPMSGMAPLDLIENAKYLAPIVIHDSTDNIVPVKNSREAVDELEKKGIPHQYIEPAHYGHDSKMIGDYLPTVLDWFENHRKITRPYQIEFTCRTPLTGNAYWLRILSFIDPVKAEGKISALLNGDRVLKIQTRNLDEFAINLQQMPGFSTDSLILSVDSSQMEIQPMENKDLLLKRDSKSGHWKVEFTDWQKIPTPKSLVIAKWNKDSAIKTDKGILAKSAAFFLNRRYKTNFCLFQEDMFQMPVGPLTREKIQDLYVYREEALAQFELDGETLQKIMKELDKDSPLVRVKPFPEIKEISPLKTYQVLAPVNIATLFSQTPQVLNDTIKEILVEEVEKESIFPPKF